MFLMLVISRLSIVRIVSAESRIASVVSLKNDVQSTTTSSCVRRSASITRLIAGRRDQLGHLRARRGEQHPDAGGVVDHERVDRLDLVTGLLELGDEVGDRLVLRVQVEQDADVAELERAVDEDDLLAELGRRGDGEVDGQGRPADAALGAEDRDDLAGLARSGSGWSRPLRGSLPRRRSPCATSSRARGSRPGGSTRSAHRC